MKLARPRLPSPLDFCRVVQNTNFVSVSLNLLQETSLEEVSLLFTQCSYVLSQFSSTDFPQNFQFSIYHCPTAHCSPVNPALTNKQPCILAR